MAVRVEDAGGGGGGYMTILDDSIDGVIEAATPHQSSAGPAEAPMGGADRAPSTLSRLARFGLWQLLAIGTTRASALLVSIVVARKLGLDAFGRYSYYSYLLNILPALFALGVPGAIAKLVAERLGGGDEETARALYRLGLRAHLMLLPVPLVVAAFVVFRGDHNALLAVSLAVGVGFGVTGLDLEGLLTATRQFHVLGLVAVLGAVTQVVLAVACALAHATWPVYVVVQTIATGAGVAVYLMFARRHLHGPRFVLPTVERSIFVRFAGVMTFSAVLNEVIFGRPELLFLSRYQGKASLGLYAVALRAASLAAILPMVVAAALLPEFARLRGSGDHDELDDAFPRICRMLILVAAPLALGGAAVAGPLTVVLYGGKYNAAGPATAILLAGSFVSSLSSVATAAVLTGPRPKLIVELGTVVALFNIAADFVLIPRFGLTGAAAVNVSVQIISVTAGIVYACTRLHLRFPFRQTAQAIGAAAIAATVAFAATRVVDGAFGLVVAVAAAAITYGVVVFGTGVATVDDLRVLHPGRRRGS